MITLLITRPLSQQTLQVAWVEITTENGVFVIQQNHAPTVYVLQPTKEVIVCLSSGKQEAISVHRGIIEVNRASITLLLDE